MDGVLTGAPLMLRYARGASPQLFVFPETEPANNPVLK